MGPFPQAAGAASALNGFAIMVVAFAIGSWLSTHLDGTVYPLALGVWFWSAAIALRLDLHQDGVLVAVCAHLDDMLHLAGRVALAPEFAARARPVVCHARLQRELEALRVHVGDHQDVASLDLGGDTDDQAGGIEGRCEGGAFLDLVLGAAGGEGRVVHLHSMEWFSLRVTPVR